ncbi:hypothetical protein COX93_02190 [Candidatus Nomurabacteria bacterium CG_4_10_14_0_2_um_filter_30_12]|uniref:PKD domain-containing protein n=1 Tax=Candidatus Nomurabacteria bacterium CG_4_10_14_0_2_um_filter_30_12 TaxID=1974727 RepID=A0A2J0MFI5_9BACT|nr:MAG: hypothetical protein COX93_02190 [Candidatus Nomurabacteria bacterium CG_4_10_14_0_2_um_filter_30_12]
MKKYILSLFMVFVLGFLLSPAFSFAQVGDVDPNPTTSSCMILENSNIRYKARDLNTNKEVSTLQDFLQSNGYLNSEQTGYFGLLTRKAVKSFQKANNISPTGYVGPVTKAKIKALSCDGYISNSDLISFSILPNQKVSGKMKAVGQLKGGYFFEGNLPISILDANKQKTSYGPGYGQATSDSYTSGPVSFEVNFDFSTIPVGNYYIKMTQNDPRNIEERKGAVPKEIFIPIIVVKSVSIPSITVLSPNGGEVYTAGQQITVRWKTSNISSNAKVYIEIYNPVSTALPLVDSIDGIKNDGLETVALSDPNIINGQYELRMYVNEALYGELARDFSDNLFTINSSTTSGPVISGVSGPQTLNVNQTGTWTVTASDPSNGNLSYSVVWGDEGMYPAPTAMPRYDNTYQTATFTHSYSKSGIYSPKFTVTNDKGGSANTSLSVNVGGVVSIPTFSVMLDPSTPLEQTITAGQNDVTFTKIKIIAGSQDLNNLSGIQIATPGMSNSLVFSNLKIYDGNVQIGATSSNFVYNGSYNYVWIYLNNHELSIPANTSKILSIKADIPSNINNYARIGIAGWNFDAPGALRTDSLGIVYGNVFNIVGSSITVLSPNGGESYVAGQQVRVSWKTNPYKEGNNIWISLHGVTEYIDLVTKHTANDGNEIVIIPSNVKSGSYKMTVAIFGVVSNTDTGAIENDSRSFTITAPVVKDTNSVSLNSALKLQSANILGALDDSSDQKKSEAKLDTSVDNSQGLICGEFTMTLKKGMKNEGVKCLQKMLNKKGFKVEGVKDGKETNYFGSATLAAFKKFQASKNLEIDGVFGPISRKALKAIAQ